MSNEDFVNLMLDKASKKEEVKPLEQLSPEKDPEPVAQRQMGPDEMKTVEEFTEELKKRLQQ